MIRRDPDPSFITTPGESGFADTLMRDDEFGIR
jgi:hypothetical protein